MTATQRIARYLTDEMIVSIYQRIICYSQCQPGIDDTKEVTQEVCAYHADALKVSTADFLAVFDVANRAIEYVKDEWKRADAEREQEENDEAIAMLDLYSVAREK